MAYDSDRTIMGTFGATYINGDKVAECTALQAKITLDKVEVPMCGVMGKRYKVVGYDAKGSITANKVTSRFGKLIAANIKQGKETVCTIISELSDPGAYGAERIALYGVKFDELTLADWAAKKIVEETMPFTFEEFEYLDMIEA